MDKLYSGKGYKAFRTDIIEILKDIQELLDAGNTFGYELSFKIDPVMNIVDPNQPNTFKYERK